MIKCNNKQLTILNRTTYISTVLFSLFFIPSWALNYIYFYDCNMRHVASDICYHQTRCVIQMLLISVFKLYYYMLCEYIWFFIREWIKLYEWISYITVYYFVITIYGNADNFNLFSRESAWNFSFPLNFILWTNQNFFII